MATLGFGAASKRGSMRSVSVRPMRYASRDHRRIVRRDPMRSRVRFAFRSFSLHSLTHLRSRIDARLPSRWFSRPFPIRSYHARQAFCQVFAQKKNRADCESARGRFRGRSFFQLLFVSAGTPSYGSCVSSMAIASTGRMIAVHEVRISTAYSASISSK